MTLGKYRLIQITNQMSLSYQILNNDTQEQKNYQISKKRRRNHLEMMRQIIIYYLFHSKRKDCLFIIIQFTYKQILDILQIINNQFQQIQKISMRRLKYVIELDFSIHNQQFNNTRVQLLKLFILNHHCNSYEIKFFSQIYNKIYLNLKPQND
ncbi:unnamed protein product [Paramecium octaurelia]|uniref:Uncharacterized protein n=1 Tax=Paramecium octaurelia TaxID=43137 RepID=A0A8S1UGJ8_PAROT|nr:unnamed protein product [Paramecium octaurelia]